MVLRGIARNCAEETPQLDPIFRLSSWPCNPLYSRVCAEDNQQDIHSPCIYIWTINLPLLYFHFGRRNYLTDDPIAWWKPTINCSISFEKEKVKKKRRKTNNNKKKNGFCRCSFLFALDSLMAKVLKNPKQIIHFQANIFLPRSIRTRRPGLNRLVRTPKESRANFRSI